MYNNTAAITSQEGCDFYHVFPLDSCIVITGILFFDCEKRPFIYYFLMW